MRQLSLPAKRLSWTSTAVFLVRIRTALALGPINVGRVMWHRMRKLSGYYRWRLPVSMALTGPAFVAAGDNDVNDQLERTVLNEADTLISGKMSLFGLDAVAVGTPPDWHTNPLSKSRIQNTHLHWSEYGDFSSGVEDIKTVWELSRFSWVLVLARSYRLTGDSSYLEKLNLWVAHWLLNNPYNRGPNWMCGQESSIRLSHVLLADNMLRRGAAPTAVLQEFVEQHCQRIRETVSYATGQRNNHGTSEALGLLVGGAWLKENAADPVVRRRGETWCRKGRALLEREVDRLVMRDGTFAQLSITYQRLFVDTVAMAEWWRQFLELETFSDTFYRRVRSATDWLFNFVDSESGDVPNIGSHDGTALFPLSGVNHRDCRPTVQLAGAMFLDKRCFDGDGPWNETLYWLGVELPKAAAGPRLSRIYADGGFAVLREPAGKSKLICRSSTTRFRPGHADAMHVDLWGNGINILRDGGTYSYSVPDNESQYFAGTESHNTAQFDGRDQMPRLGRFLFGAWLESEVLSSDVDSDQPRWCATYTDHWGARHTRQAIWRNGDWIIVDDLSGFQKRAVLRWRVCPEFELSLIHI